MVLASPLRAARKDKCRRRQLSQPLQRASGRGLSISRTAWSLSGDLVEEPAQALGLVRRACRGPPRLALLMRIAPRLDPPDFLGPSRRPDMAPARRPARPGAPGDAARSSAPISDRRCRIFPRDRRHAVASQRLGRPALACRIRAEMTAVGAGWRRPAPRTFPAPRMRHVPRERPRRPDFLLGHRSLLVPRRAGESRPDQHATAVRVHQPRHPHARSGEVGDE